ncbi:MAG: iron export ABC transporter permease subunit FetB [Devosiaceae bacterium]|nr:iron export ABC transporter permease subunit FetB [Devosiaceae bacterium]
MADYISLSYWDLALGAIFILLNGAISIAFRLGLAKKLFIVTFRMVVQLSIVALLLKGIFAISNPWITLLVALVMVLFAGREIYARQEKKLAGFWGFSIGAGSMMVAGMLVTLIALTTQIQPDPWFKPQFALPLFGMILGNTMTGVSLALDNLTTTLKREQRAVEALLLLGKTRFQAMLPFIRIALRAGFMPIINAMAAMGIVSLPGMMTGQILSGVDPAEAVKYQILILLLIGGATGLGVISATLLSAYRLSDNRDRLRLDRLKPAK